MIEETRIWPKRISVDKRIVRILSASTYDNFPNAIKEIITNSYDADATLVSLTINLKTETIVVEDDGTGMSEADFALYLRIAGMKRASRLKTKSGRFILGQFGVGFLSVFPFFKNYTIESKVANSSEILYAEIPCHLYFGSNSVDIGAINVMGGIKYDKSKLNKHYTRITLSGFTELAKAFFFPKKDNKPRKNSILNSDSVTILKWRLSEDLPLDYEDKKLNKHFSKYSPNSPFKVTVNSDHLVRKTYGKEILEVHNGDYVQLGKIKYRYFICTDREPINDPIEGRFLKIRNLNAGVGDRTTFGLGTEIGGARSRLHWLSGEIHIVEGLNDIIATARDKFNYDPDYENLKDEFVKKLSFHSTQLEREDELKKFALQPNESGENKIKNIKLLSPQNIEKKIKALQKGASLNRYISTDLENQNLGPNLDLEKLRTHRKKIKIGSETYEVILDDWDYRKDQFSACKIEKRKLFINQNYPLFKSVKYTDIFIKLHVLLLSHLDKNTLTTNNYKAISKDILKIYADYLK